MPTGYTSGISDEDISFSEFIKRCAHAFLLETRDESMTSEIKKEIEISTYHKYELKKATDLLDDLKCMDSETVKRKSKESYCKKVEARKIAVKNNISLMNKYYIMLKQVSEWDVPSELQGLRMFMIQQLESSIKSDNMSDYYNEHPIEKISPKQWKQNMIKDAQWHVDYHAKELGLDKERAAQRNAWVKTLFENIPEQQINPVGD